MCDTVVVLLFAIESSGWYEQEGHVVCSNCIRKYNGSAGDASSGDTAEDGAEPPPFMFRPVKEEQDMDWKHSVRDSCYFFGNDILALEQVS